MTKFNKATRSTSIETLTVLVLTWIGPKSNNVFKRKSGPAALHGNQFHQTVKNSTRFCLLLILFVSSVVSNSQIIYSQLEKKNTHNLLFELKIDQNENNVTYCIYFTLDYTKVYLVPSLL